jgi:CheY-like chemotaxis protein
VATELVQIATELVNLIPSILWFSLVIFVLVLFCRPIRDELLPNLSAFKAMGVELSFIKDFIDTDLELAEKSPQWKIKVSSKDKERTLKRAKKHLAVFRDAQFLWVDDHPENNLSERKMFRQLKAEVDIAKSTEEALKILKSDHYDLVISDMARDNDDTAGLNFLEQFRKENKSTPVIFYVGVFDPDKGVPKQTFGITNRSDELLHLILDALERKKY